MSEYQKLSSDLSRITEFLISGNQSMAQKFSDRVVNLYANLPGYIGQEKLSDYLQKIANLEGGSKKTAERAMTASTILANKSYA